MEGSKKLGMCPMLCEDGQKIYDGISSLAADHLRVTLSEDKSEYFDYGQAIPKEKSKQIKALGDHIRGCDECKEHVRSLRKR
jgi:hypothetical protein